MPQIKVNDANFYYELHGQGQPLVCVTGYTGDHRYWLSMLEQLSQNHQVLIFDNRGVGQTEDNTKELSAELMAQDAVELAKALGIEKAHYAGVSMGGTIVQTVAALYPKAIDKLIIGVSTAKWREAMLMAFKTSLHARAMDRPLDEIINQVFPWVFSQKTLTDTKQMAMIMDYMKNDPCPQSLENQQRQYRVLKMFDGTKRLKDIKAETLVVYGDEDIISLPQESAYLTKNIAKATDVALPCAHALSMEQPQAFAKLITNFLADK